MADQRLTDKTALTEVAQDDLVHVVDVSDTTANAEGTSKKVAIANLKTFVLPTLQEVTTNGATSNVETDFTTLVNGKVVTYDGEAVSVFRGEWNASTNTPALDNTDTGVKGFFYRVTVAGTVDFGDGNITFNVGDYVAFEIDKWVKFISNGNNFIPLSGTTSGNPVTGEIEFEEFGRTFWTPSENAPNDYNFINLNEAAVLIGYMNEISSEEFTAAIGLTGLSIMANIDGSGGIENSKGISSNLYFGANYDDNTYVQKKYVDDTKNITTGYTVAALPASPVAGQRAHVTDSSVAMSGNYGAIVAGGGANFAPVIYDGSNWRIG